MEGRDVDFSVNFYQVLEVDPSATAQAIKKAYQKKALVLHPDKQKNPTPESIKLFHTVQTAYEVLTDPEARRAFDSLMNAQMQAAQKKASMSEHRRNLQDDLERREMAAQMKAQVEKAEAALRRQMDRIRTENMARTKRERTGASDVQQVDPVEDTRKRKMVVPHSQSYASLEDYEKVAFAALQSKR